MRTPYDTPKPKSYDYITINRFHLPDDDEFIDDFCVIENDKLSFNLLTDVCIPISLLLVIVIWGYKMDAMGVDADGTLVLVYGIVLIVATGATCGYIALRMTATPTYKPISMLPREVKHIPLKKSNFQMNSYQTIPEVHRNGKTPTLTFMV
ncbi:uncharacterized protein LOC126907440 [Daktulosphaira vitifoliae]|uniref:uncharacterized protein LOC126907440 n=1 Tax=Daktulosphaira vitifoliae TaxID=58002 RepID=UPI0021A9C93C|nr:uncharacterized protein LOC126907440 [Daktulosphaira vitifoliae]